MSIIELNSIKKTYGKKESKIDALKGISLNIEKGEMTAIMGPSGCGKSTLLNIIGCIDTPSGGKYILDGQEISKYNFNKLSEIRNNKLSFVFQNFALMKEFSVLDNIIVPLNFRRMSMKKKKAIAFKYMERLKIGELANKKVSNLSGGQQQRTAIARALVQESNIILADEPTGALDQANGQNIMRILKDLNINEGKTIIVVTHDPHVASFCDKIINLKDGLILSNEAVSTL